MKVKLGSVFKMFQGSNNQTSKKLLVRNVTQRIPSIMKANNTTREVEKEALADLHPRRQGRYQRERQQRVSLEKFVFDASFVF